jgi:hypothetical protein
MEKKSNKPMLLLMVGVCVAAIVFFNYQLFMLVVESIRKFLGI